MSEPSAHHRARPPASPPVGPDAAPTVAGVEVPDGKGARMRRGWMQRSQENRMLAGVAGGLGDRLGVDPVLVRIGFVVLTFAGGVGPVLYLVLWLTSPLAVEETRTPSRRPTVQQAVALAFITLGVLLLLRRLGLWFGDALVWPVVVGAAGSAVLWTRGDDMAPAPGSGGLLARTAGRPGPVGTLARVATSPVSPVRVIAGTVLVVLGVTGFVAGTDGFAALSNLSLPLVASAGGLLLLVGPGLMRLLDDLGSERRERARQEARAELAAHLHDSVLQTLALIQRSSDDPRRIATLARVQERELRAWLYGSGRPSAAATPVTLTDAVEQVAAEVEALHHLAVDVVVVGDVPVDDRVRALLGAIREAATNAAKHAEVDEVAVFVEVVPDDGELVGFVRDRGVGFAVQDVLATVGDDHRRGVRDSIVGRLERHGGRATIRSSPGNGTEVELAVPLAAGWPPTS